MGKMGEKRKQSDEDRGRKERRKTKKKEMD